MEQKMPSWLEGHPWGGRVDDFYKWDQELRSPQEGLDIPGFERLWAFHCPGERKSR
jgi:hypothetical protein